MEASAPDLITAVIGFRQWRVCGDGLWSFRATERWHRGVHTAHCAAHAHDAPANGCTCGIYAWYSPTPRGASALTPDLVGGAVALWGHIELHAHGMRAQHAMVVALALPFSWGAKRRRIRAAADALEVPSVPAHRLRAAALAHGDLIPRQMRPPDTTPNKRAAPGEPAPARLYAVADGYHERQGPERGVRISTRSADAAPAPLRDELLVDTGLEYGPGDPVHVWVTHRERRVSVSDHGAALEKSGAAAGWERASARVLAALDVNVTRAGVVWLPVVAVGPSEEEVARRIGRASLIFFQELLELDA